MIHYVILLSLFLCGCAPKITMHPIMLEQQDTIYRDGNEAIMSAKESSVVTFSPVQDTIAASERPKLFFTFKNTYKEPIEISNDNILVIHDGKPLHVYTYEELVNEVNRQAFWQKMSLAVSTVANAVCCAHSMNHSCHNSYNHNTENLLLANDINHLQEKALDALSFGYLKRNTLLPGEQVCGYVTTECLKCYPFSKSLQIAVNVGADLHRFSLVYQKFIR